MGVVKGVIAPAAESWQACNDDYDDEEEAEHASRQCSSEPKSAFLDLLICESGVVDVECILSRAGIFGDGVRCDERLYIDELVSQHHIDAMPERQLT